LPKKDNGFIAFILPEIAIKRRKLGIISAAISGRTLQGARVAPQHRPILVAGKS